MMRIIHIEVLVRIGRGIRIVALVNALTVSDPRIQQRPWY